MTTPVHTYDFSKYADDGVLADEPANRYRFSLIVSPHPRWNYVTAVVVGGLWEGFRPTDAELAMVGSFHEEYCERRYGHRRPEMRRKHPFDIDGGANSRFLIKHEDGGWGYRHRSWRIGPEFLPAWNTEPHSLIEVLDYEAKPNDERWAAWKAARPEIFAVAL